MSDSDFISIHSHTDGSILDSQQTVEKWLDTIQSKGQPAACLTDHGSMVNTIQFYQEAKKRGMKPMIGEEFYFSDEGIHDKEATKLAKTDSAAAVGAGILGVSHLVVIAKNYTGYTNLCKMSAISHTDGYYYNPRIDFDILEKHKEGLIISTACMFGSFSKRVARGEYDKAEVFASKMHDIFGDDFYIEVQNHGFPEQHRYIPKAMEIANKLGVNLIATQDVHYARPEDWKFQDALFCIGKHQDWKDPKRRRACKEMYVKSRDEMETAFQGFDVPKSVFDNSLTIMHKCADYELKPKDYLLPKFLGSKELSDRKLKDLCRDGWKVKLSKKLENNPALKQVYTDRVNYELNVIKSMGFSDYFLIVQDFINETKKHNIPVGPGRGSAAGCLVSYLIGITKIDPIEYNLMFERFLVPGRPTMPDIDVDVADRDFVVQYLEDKYGRDKVSPILNRATVTAKAALIKVASILGNYKLGQDISALIKKVRGETPSFSEVLHDVVELQAKKLEHPELFELAEGLEGATLSLSGNASGIVVSSIPISDVVPLHQSKGKVYTAYDKDQISYMKMVKLDVLGLDILTTIDGCLKLIKKRHDKDIDLDSIDTSDEKVWDLLCEADTIGIFQFESALMKDLMKRIVPRNLVELALINAMGRPGALDNPGLINSLSERKLGRETISYPHEALTDLLRPTYGYMLYQEQIMKMSQLIAGFSIEEADKFRKGCSDKKAEVIEEMRPKFMAGCDKNGYTPELAKSLFDQALLFAGYGFNISHSIAYSYLAYQTAWLKTYYPLEFLVSCMNTQVGNAIELGDITKFVVDLERHGYTIKAPDVTQSVGTSFIISETELDKDSKPVVYYCLGALKGVSPTQIDHWLQLKPFKDLNDAVIKAVVTSCSSANVRILAEVGAFRSLAPNTAYVDDTMENRIAEAKKAVSRVKSKFQRTKAKAQKNKATSSSLELGLEMRESPELVEPDWHDVKQYNFSMPDEADLMATPLVQTKFNAVKKEIEYIGLAISGTLLDEYEASVRKHADMSTTWFVTNVTEGQSAKVAGVITGIRKLTDRNGRRMAFATISDGRSEVRLVIFASLYNKFQDATWKNDKAVAVDGRKDKDSLIAGDITFLRKDSDPNVPKETEGIAEEPGI